MCWTFIAIQEWKDFQLPGCLQYRQLEGDGELSQQNDGRNGFLISEPSAIKESSTKKCARTKPSLQTEFKLRYHPKKKSTDMSTLSTSVAETLKKANAESQALQVPAEISRAPQKCRLLYLTTVTHRWFFTFSLTFTVGSCTVGPGLELWEDPGLLHGRIQHTAQLGSSVTPVATLGSRFHREVREQSENQQRSPKEREVPLAPEWTLTAPWGHSSTAPKLLCHQGRDQRLPSSSFLTVN